MLKFKSKLYLPKGYVEIVIREYYNNLLQGHLEIIKTLEIIERIYTRPKL